jgi:predicted dehydrogenase
MGRAHLAAWRQTGAEVAGIVAEHLPAAARLAEPYGLRAYEGYEELLAEVDVIDLCVPTDLHRDMTLQAAEASRHVVCEKPIALTLGDGRAMIAACERAGVRLFVAMVLRFFPQYRAAAEAVRAGQVGALGVVRLKRVSYAPRQGETSWFADESRSGGMLLDLMVHDFDYALSLAGRAKRVYAKSVRALRPDAPGDYALVTLRFESGAMALVEGGWAYPPGVFRTGFDLAGTDGVLEWDSDSTETVHSYLLPSGPDKVAAVGLPLSALAEDPYTTEIKHVHDAFVHDKPFAVTPEEALAALEVALAARESLRTGRSVTLGGR